MKKVMQGKPYAGNPHVRFDEGAGAPRHSGRSALLYNKMLMLIGAAAFFVVADAMADFLVAPVNATAQSFYQSGDDERSPMHAIDGSGMSPVPVTAASAASTSTAGCVWLSENSPETWIAFDLGEEKTVTGLRLWNYNEFYGGRSYAARGIRTARIYVGDTMPPQGGAYFDAGAAWGRFVADAAFKKATASASYTGEDFQFAAPVRGRYFQIVVTSSHRTREKHLGNYVGLSEIAFYVDAENENGGRGATALPAGEGRAGSPRSRETRDPTAASGRVTVVDNGVIVREVDVSGGGVRSASYQLSRARKNYLHGGSREFSLMVNGKLLTGQDAWANPRVARQVASDGTRTTVLSFDRPDGSLSVSLAYAARPGVPLVSKTLDVRNTGKADVCVEAVNVEDFATTFWVTHSHVYRRYARFRAIGPYVGDWEDPLVAVHDASHTSGMVVGNETVSVLKRTGVFEDGKSLRVGTTTPDAPYPFRRWLRAGKSWRSAAVFTVPYADAYGPEQAIEGTVADHVRTFASLDAPERGLRPMFIYSSWEPFAHRFDEKLTLELAEAAAACGITDFEMDWAMHANKTPSGLKFGFGDYAVDTNKFPRGLKPVFARVRELGMRPTLYFCLGQVSANAEVRKAHPEWMVRSADGRIVNLHTPRNNDATACFGTGWKDYIGKIIADHAKEYGLSYIKLDLAIATSAYIYDSAWSGCYAKDHPGHRDRPESFDVIYANCLDMFDCIHRAAPGAYIDCTFESAGKLQLIDYGLLRHADGNWLSNIGEGMRGNMKARLDTLPCRMRQIAWERALAVPTSALIIGNLWISDPNRILAFKSLAGALPVMLGDPRRVPQAERAELKRLVKAFCAAGERHGFMAYRQDLPGFGEPGEGRWDGFARINTTTRTGGIVGVFRQNAAEPSRVVVVNGLDSDATYAVTRLADGAPVASATGAELARKGFRVAFDKMIDGELFEVRLEK